MPQFTRSSRRGHRSIAKSLGSVLVVACLIAMGCAFAPVPLGGRVSYVVTEGVSMLPRFKADGLVLTRSEGQYRVGEVVAYHNRVLGAVVMHRIVARAGNRFVFKGDNNGFADQYRPTKSELVGKEWAYIPGTGRYLKLLRHPGAFAVLIGLLTVFSLRAPVRSRRRRRHHAC